MTVDPQVLLDDVGPASLVEMGTLVADLGPRHILEGAPFGTRVIVDVTDMRIEGNRLTARMKGTAAADWGSGPRTAPCSSTCAPPSRPTTVP